MTQWPVSGVIAEGVGVAHEVWGRFKASFTLFRIAASSTPLFDFWDDVVVILDRHVVCIFCSFYKGQTTELLSQR